MLFILVLISILTTGWVGLRFFYYAPQKAIVNVPRGLVSVFARSGMATLALCKKLWQQVFLFAPWMRRQRLLWVLLVIVLASVAITLAMSRRFWLERPSAADIRFSSNAQLAFSEEKLAPPSALPPSIFVGYERLALESADRDWNKLQPVFRQSLLVLLSHLAGEGYPFVLLEGYRSPERQDALAAMGSHLTQARAFESRHQYGLAADIAPIRNGVLAFDFNDPWTRAAYLALGEEARSMGIVWGGLWKMQDYGHVEVSFSK
jgi:peptidoglycan L-alanyl-D-glutamate endopeptidase CwlK